MIKEKNKNVLLVTASSLGYTHFIPGNFVVLKKSGKQTRWILWFEGRVEVAANELETDGFRYICCMHKQLMVHCLSLNSSGLLMTIISCNPKSPVGVKCGQLLMQL